MAKGQDLLFKQHNAKASLEEFKRASKLDPWYGQAYLLQGLAHMQLQQWSEAQWAFEEAAKVEPGNAKAYLGAGSALNEQKDFAGALPVSYPLQRLANAADSYCRTLYLSPTH